MRKTNLITLFIASILISSPAVAGAPKAELIKAEPIQKTNLETVEKALHISLETLAIDTDFTLSVKNNSFAVQKQREISNKIAQVTSNQIAAD